MFTRFRDMHSNGTTKLPPYECIYIEAPEVEARTIFYNRFERDPYRVACASWDEDYSYDEYVNLEQATAYDRGCRHDAERDEYVEEPYTQPRYRPHTTLADYLTRADVLVIRADEILPEERTVAKTYGAQPWNF